MSPPAGGGVGTGFARPAGPMLNNHAAAIAPRSIWIFFECMM
jgi:hypothetical protein